jgi:hypothetical protein
MTKYVKVLITIITVLIAVISVKLLVPDQAAQTDGEITFILEDADKNEVIHEVLYYYEGDTLFDILNREYTLVCADIEYDADSTCSYESPYGKAILEINTVKSDWYNNFLALYINDEYATYGVSKLPYKSGDVIVFKWTSLS